MLKFLVMWSALLLLARPVVADDMTQSERQLVETAIRTCPVIANGKLYGKVDPESIQLRTQVDPYVLLALLRAEQSAGVPRSLSGMTLAAACKESKFNALAVDARGATGFFQIESSFSKIKFDRRDPVVSAHYWLAGVVAQLPKVKKLCKKKKVVDVWKTAWTRAARGGPKHRCTETVGHYEVLLRLQRLARMDIDD